MQQGWLRKALAIVLGVIVAGGCIAAIESVGHRFGGGESAFVVAIGALFIGALAGGILAVRVAESSLHGWIVAAILALLSLINVVSFAHPTWFVPVADAVLLAAGWLSSRTLPRKAVLP